MQCFLDQLTLVQERDRKGSIGGRTMEIQRLIGRSLRSVLDLSALQGYTLTIDCDVLQADGGTRTASITGAFACYGNCLQRLAGRSERSVRSSPIEDDDAAASLGILARGKVNLDPVELRRRLCSGCGFESGNDWDRTNC